MPYYQLHPDRGMNFQINRVLTYGQKAGLLEEIKSIVLRIKDFESWYIEWVTLAKRAENVGRYLHAAYYYRMAEFFLTEEKEAKTACYKAFKKNFYRAIGKNAFERFKVPYENKFLPALCLKAPKEKAIILIHGGYDSFIEEFYLSVRTLPQKGYTLILFEGPGQGEALKNGLRFTHEWEKPTAAILDYFQLNEAVLVGISWGGFLALRAAAFEPRIRQVVAYDVLYDGLEVLTRPMPLPIRHMLQLSVRSNFKRLVNFIVERLRKKSPLLNWAISQGMYITGTKSPFEFYKNISQHTMWGISQYVRQDVLLLAGEHDHYVPVNHLYRLKRELNNACSVTTRLFTEEEGGDQHCQVGNHQLAINEIIRWLSQFYG